MPVGHRRRPRRAICCAERAPPPQIPLAEALERLKPLLEDAGVLKIGQNIKYDIAGHGAPGHRDRGL